MLIILSVIEDYFYLNILKVLWISGEARSAGSTTRSESFFFASFSSAFPHTGFLLSLAPFVVAEWLLIALGLKLPLSHPVAEKRGSLPQGKNLGLIFDSFDLGRLTTSEVLTAVMERTWYRSDWTIYDVLEAVRLGSVPPLPQMHVAATP